MKRIAILLMAALFCLFTVAGCGSSVSKNITTPVTIVATDKGWDS